MMPLAPVADAGRLIVNPHPVLLDGRTNVPADLRPGETLYAFLSRHVDLSEQWEVRVGGEVVPVEMWMRVKPKHGQVIEVVHAVNRQALYLVAFIALTYFTMGAGATAGSALLGAGASAGAVMAVNMAVYVGGSILINKVLGPKQPEPVAEKSRDSVYSINSARNQMRPYDPVGLLFGHTRITPDLASAPYIWHEGDDQYLGMVLNVGANVHDVGDIYHGDGLLSQFDGVQVYYNGIPGKPDQTIPLYSNADTIEGGELEKTTAWVQRTTPPETRRIQLNIEGTIGDRTSKGKDYYNAETIQAEYRPVGSSTWQVLVTRRISNANGKNFEIQRVTLSRDVAEGQYDVRVRRLYTAQDVDKGDQYWSAQTQFQWTTMVAVQSDDATYAGMGRIGIRVRATGQLSGALDQLRMEAWSRPIPVWNGTAWVTEVTSNPGALILQFLRGIHDENGRIIAGLGLDEDEIDVPSLQAFMVHCAAEGYQYNHYLRDVRNNGDQLAAMARAGFGAMSWESGRWGVVWAADGQPVSGVVNMATIKRGQFQVDYTLAQAADGIEYTYLDSSDWQVKTIRVPAPGVDTMLNPATVQAEGVSTEAHAAQMARWHLAQSLYQYKDIVFSTDLEHLAYKRMDVLQLQHDLTQWGYGGRLVSVDGNVLTLDEPVPGNAVAWIGVRVPGESVYRTLRVQAFEGESDTITLLDAWPSDADLPGEDNPAHDHIWIYDFKATPGYRVRVVGKELESDAKGASVAVVPEGPEFWNYVKTGEYIPPQPGSLLDTRPKASNVAVSEVQVVTGDVIHTELAVTFDLDGPAARTVVFAGIQGSEIGPVAETVTQTARFRIGSAGTYTIVVRPYNADGIAGEAATVTYTTEGTDIPPPPFDWVSVTVEPAGLRRYAWGYHQFQPADLAGAEIRFMPGTVAEPEWETMTPLGADGFFTAAFESDVPVAGDWTFAFSAINTAGDLSAPVVTHVTLTENVGEHLQDHEDRITDTQQIAQEILDDFADMAAEVDRVEAEAKAAAAALNLRADQLRDDIDATMAQLNDILGAEEWDAGTAYAEGDLVQFDGKLYRALQAVAAGTPVTDGAYWELLGDYASLGDAVAAALSQLSAHADELLAHAESLNLLGAKNGAGTAWLLNMDTVRVSASETMAQWRSSLQSQFGDANARIDAEETARADGDSALATTLATVQATANNAATKAELTSAQNTLAAADQALGERIDVTQARFDGEQLLLNGDFEREDGWAVSESLADAGTFGLPAGFAIEPEDPFTGRSRLHVTAGPDDRRMSNFITAPVDESERIYASYMARVSSIGGVYPNVGASFRIGVQWYGADGLQISRSWLPAIVYTGGFSTEYAKHEAELTPPVGAKVMRVIAQAYGGAQTGGQFKVDAVRFERRGPAQSALASVVSITRAEVSDIDDTVAAHTTQIATHTAAIAGKANSSTVTALDNYVKQDVDGRITAQGTQLSGLSADVGGNSASINEVREVQASMQGVGIVANASFEDGGEGWDIVLGGGVEIGPWATARTGSNVLTFNSGHTQSRTVRNTARTPVVTGQQIRFGAWLRYSGSAGNIGAATVQVAIAWNDASGSRITRDNLTISGSELSTSWQKFDLVRSAPTGAATANIEFWVSGHESGSGTIRMTIRSNALTIVRRWRRIKPRSGFTNSTPRRPWRTPSCHAPPTECEANVAAVVRLSDPPTAGRTNRCGTGSGACLDRMRAPQGIVDGCTADRRPRTRSDQSSPTAAECCPRDK